MITYCTHCGIQWAKLWTSKDGEIEFCPECSTDTFLQDSTDFVGYIKCPISGKITNAFTGDELNKETEDAISAEKPRVRVVVGKPERETIEEREVRELAGIEAYHASGNSKDYFTNIKKLK